MKPQEKPANVINHIALVLDASGSMQGLKKRVVEVADSQIKHLAQRSREMDQETRVSVYTFDYHYNIQCPIFDKDVLRLPSMQGLYQPSGATALIDATLKALDDLATTSTLYGDHSFLIYILTDGQENSSQHHSAELERTLLGLADEWTLACFVPDARGIHEAKRFGFQKDNIAVWNTDEAGILEVGEAIRKATDNYMAGRARGLRGSKNLFALDASGLSPSKVKAELKGLNFGQFRFLDVKIDVPIAQFIEAKLRRPYRMGEAYYQLSKPETIQPQKQIALFSVKESKVYVGEEARQLLKLPDYEVRVKPQEAQGWEIFVQSTSVNRKLISGTRLLVLS